MKEAALFLMANITSALAIIGAVVLAYNGKDGWGWLVFLAAICHVTIKWERKSND